MANDLAGPSDLVDYPGAPFPESVVDSAVAGLRTEAGWHIAPTTPETFILDGSPTTVLILPTLHLVSVAEIRDVSGDTPVVLTGWRKSKSKGLIYHRCGWPIGFETVEVEAAHGHSETPKELFPVIAELCQLSRVNTTVSQESAGAESVSYRNIGGLSQHSSAVFARYKITNGF